MKTSLVRLDFRDLTAPPVPFNLYKDAGSNYRIKFIDHAQEYLIFYELLETEFTIVIWDTKNTTPGYAGDKLINIPTDTMIFNTLEAIAVSQDGFLVAHALCNVSNWKMRFYYKLDLVAKTYSYAGKAYANTQIPLTEHI